MLTTSNILGEDFEGTLNNIRSAVLDIVKTGDWNSGNFPAYNIVKISDDENLIELALAGYLPNEVDITLENNKLTIQGAQTPNGKSYLHKGITEGKFVRTFALASGSTVKSASFVNGILTIRIHCEKKSNKIKIDIA